MDRAASSGFRVEDGYLRVDVEEYLHTREVLARVARGESKRSVADDSGVPESTLRSLYNDRRELYLAAEADDERVQEALGGVSGLDDPSVEESVDLDNRIREVVQEEIEDATAE